MTVRTDNNDTAITNNKQVEDAIGNSLSLFNMNKNDNPKLLVSSSSSSSTSTTTASSLSSASSSSSSSSSVASSPTPTRGTSSSNLSSTTDDDNDVVGNNNDSSNKKKENEQQQQQQKDDEEYEIRTLLSLDKTYGTNELHKTIHLNDVTILNLTNTGISSLPDSIPTLLPNLQILFCSNNYFETLPIVVGKCLNLSMIAFKSCRMKYIPKECFQKQLKWLILTDNQIQELPYTIGNCIYLQKVALSGNLLSSIPETIKNCIRLELIRLASNQFTIPPMNLLLLPNLKWIALSDNPFLQAYVTSKTYNLSKLPTLVHIPDDQGQILGQGAGGITRKYPLVVDHNNSGNNNDDDDNTMFVAVKQYPTTVEITTDGKPEQEMLINSYIGTIIHEANQQHFHKQQRDDGNNNKYKAFVQVLGKTESGGALIMEYLNNYIPLAKPPSFTTCTRCVYYNDNHNTNGLSSSLVYQSVTLKQAISIVSDLLNALTILHNEMNIIHGDFYGHNILLQKLNHSTNNDTDTPNVRVSDFGAGFMYEPNTEYGVLLQQIEIRAFFVLVNEINQYLIIRENNNNNNKGNDTTSSSISNTMEEKEQQNNNNSNNNNQHYTTTILYKLTQNKESYKTFRELQIYWNQLKLQQIAKEFDL